MPATEIVCGLWLADMHAVTNGFLQDQTTLFISVCKAPVVQYDIFIRRIANRLLVVDSFTSEFDKICGAIDRELRKGGIVTVFCETKRQRSPSLLLAYLMIKAGLTYETAFQCLCSKDNEVFPDPCIYKTLLKKYEQTIDVSAEHLI
ncbi:MAG: hypothetical protein EOP45_14040 [Sphingobacteriaceae bacterium]|nr:MAG: hypothetical protein EOP45_14040 [Sphingobacteriaceae bacterium]